MISSVMGLIAFGWVSRKGVIYQANWSYVVSIGEREAKDDFRFDGYYAVSTADLLTTTLAGLIETPETIAEAGLKSGLEIVSLEDVEGKVSAEKVAPQLVRVKVRTNSYPSVERLSQEFRNVVRQRLNEYSTQEMTGTDFIFTESDEWISVEEPKAKLAGLVAGVGSLLLVSNGVLLAVSFRHANRN
jgi:hypothetical protein